MNTEILRWTLALGRWPYIRMTGILETPSSEGRLGKLAGLVEPRGERDQNGALDSNHSIVGRPFIRLLDFLVEA